MKKITITLALIFSFLGIITIPVNAESSLQKVRNYFLGRKRVTMVGVISISGENKIYFKNESGKLFKLDGKQSKIFMDKKGDTVQITGYVKKHSFEVRKYKIIKKYVEPEPAVSDDTESDIDDSTDVSEDSDKVNSSDSADVSEGSDKGDSKLSGINDDLKLDSNDEDVSSDSETYTVVKGDTLGKISHKFFGTTAKWKKIAKDNNIKDPRKIKVGDVLTINKD